MRIAAAAPTRVDLAGGTLDIWPLYLFHSGALTVNCAITRRASCILETRSGAAIELVSRDTRRRERFASWDALARQKTYKLPLLAHLVRFFRPRLGFRLVTDSQAPAGAGIGGSSAMAVALCAALDRLAKAGMGRREWIHVSRDVEAAVIGAPTGCQDHYPAAFGGIAALHLDAGGEWREALPTNPAALERRLLLCYTGKPRQSAINNLRVFTAHLNGDRRVRANLEHIAVVARSMRTAIAEENWRETGRLVNEEWEFRRRNLPTISTPVIDRILATTRRQGALAGKVCGAGGGGCVALLIEPEARERVEAAVQAAGGTVLPAGIDRHGVRVEAIR
jgi:D-glycero-alpha-D-manno-heptose-7-phosphate kinase